MTNPLFSETELRNLLQRDEGQFIEFKSLWDQSVDPPRPLDRRAARDMVVECVAAFANADGGTLVLGVDDDGIPSGHAYPEEAVQDLLAVPDKRLRPPVRCQTQRARLDDKDLLIFQVPFTPEAVMVDGNGFPYRVGDRVIREPQEVINARKEAYQRVGFERRVRPEATLADLDLDLAAKFLALTVYEGRRVEDALEQYGLMIPRAGGVAITNACLLLFGKTPLVRWHPRAGIRFFRVAGTERRHGARRNVTQLGRVELPITGAIPEAHRLAKEQIRRSEKLHDLFFREMPEYPEFAWQEAMINAVAHRDYEDQTREVEVWFFEDRMEVRSPGEPVPPVTIDLLRQHKPIHASRNPLIVRVLSEAKIMREEGEGIPRMFEEMEESYLHAPALAIEGGEFTVTLSNEPVFLGPSPEWQQIVHRLPLSGAQKRVLLAHPDGFANEDYRGLNNIDRDQAYREIQEMVNLGVVTPPDAHGRGAVYRLAPNLHETRAFLSARLAEIRSYFTTHDRLKNSDYRQLFGVTRFAAVRELRRLVEQGYLHAEGERRGARYVPGPALAVSQPK